MHKEDKNYILNIIMREAIILTIGNDKISTKDLKEIQHIFIVQRELAWGEMVMIAADKEKSKKDAYKEAYPEYEKFCYWSEKEKEIYSILENRKNECFIKKIIRLFTWESILKP